MARRALSPACLRVVQAVRAWSGTPVTVACSGGADSLALTAGVAHLLRSGTLAGDAVVIDHALQRGSDQVSEQVAGRVRELGLAVSVVRVTVPADSALGPEGAAREARYEALARAASGTVLLGHTLDDQAETVLLGLARGSGTRSLAGMAETTTWSGTPFARPLLGLRRADTAQACRDWGLTVWDDPHNVEPRFLRSRLRTEAMPVLERVLGPGVPEALTRSAGLLRADADLLDELADQAWGTRPPDARPDLDLGWLTALPPALRGRVLRRWLAEGGVPEINAGHLAAVVTLIEAYHGQRGIDLPGARRVSRSGSRLTCQALGG